MTQQIQLSTTGTVSVAVIDGYEFTHPTTNLNLILPDGFLTSAQLQESKGFQAAVDANEITLVDDLGKLITNVGNQTETRSSGNITISNPVTAEDLEIGWIEDLTSKDPSAFGIRRRTGSSGYLCYMPSSQSPQIVMGDPSGDNTAHIDVTNNGTMIINGLDTGAGTPGRTFFGQGGLSVGSTNATIPNLSLTSITGNRDWDIYVGSPANFDGWLRFSTSRSSNQNELALLPDGSLKGLDCSAKSPTFGFLDLPGYGVFANSKTSALGISADGVARQYWYSDGTLQLVGFPEGILTSSATGVIESKPFSNVLERKVAQVNAEDTLSFASGSITPTSYQLIPNTSITLANTIAKDYLVTTNFACRVTNNNGRVLRFTLHINGAPDADFTRLVRFDQANDDKSITIRWDVLNLAAGATVDLRVRNEGNTAILQVNTRNVTAEEF